MRKRSTQEILEVLGVYGDPDLVKKREKEVAAQKKKDQNKKPDLETAKIRDLEARTDYTKAKRDAVVAKTEKNKEDARRKSDEQAATRISKATERAKKIAGDKP